MLKYLLQVWSVSWVWCQAPANQIPACYKMRCKNHNFKHKYNCQAKLYICEQFGTMIGIVITRKLTKSSMTTKIESTLTFRKPLSEIQAPSHDIILPLKGQLSTDQVKQQYSQGPDGGLATLVAPIQHPLWWVELCSA